MLGPLQICVDGAAVTVGSIGIDSRTALMSAPPGYRLTVPENACDIGRFALENAGVQAAAAGKFEQASRHLSAALSEWRAPYSTIYATSSSSTRSPPRSP